MHNKKKYYSPTIKHDKTFVYDYLQDAEVVNESFIMCNGHWMYFIYTWPMYYVRFSLTNLPIPKNWISFMDVLTWKKQRTQCEIRYARASLIVSSHTAGQWLFFNRCAVSLHLGDTLVRGVLKKGTARPRGVWTSQIPSFLYQALLMFSKNPHLLIIFWKSAKTFVKSTQLFWFFPTSCNAVSRYTFF